jgi:hypothetical protein
MRDVTAAGRELWGFIWAIAVRTEARCKTQRKVASRPPCDLRFLLSAQLGRHADGGDHGHATQGLQDLDHGAHFGRRLFDGLGDGLLQVFRFTA